MFGWFRRRPRPIAATPEIAACIELMKAEWRSRHALGMAQLAPREVEDFAASFLATLRSGGGALAQLPVKTIWIMTLHAIETAGLHAPDAFAAVFGAILESSNGFARPPVASSAAGRQPVRA